MELQPKRPPGRTDRKAARYAADIARLRSAGYTYEAIREALADVGLAVSTSALRREVLRLRQRSPHASSRQQRAAALPIDTAPSPSIASPVPTSASSHAPPMPVAPLPRAPPPLAPNGGTPAAPVVEHTRAAAEAFFSANPSRLLHPNKEIP